MKYFCHQNPYRADNSVGCGDSPLAALSSLEEMESDHFGLEELVFYKGEPIKVDLVEVTTSTPAKKPNSTPAPAKK